MKIKLGKLNLKNPVLLASGTFDRTITHFINPNNLGGVVTKTITVEPKMGNPLPHIIKTKYGFLNSVGLKNPGIKKYLKDELPFWQKFETEVIPSIGGENEKEYIELAEIFDRQKINAIEVNISCPNIDRGGLAFGTDPKIAGRLTKKIRKVFRKTLILKLSPNVTDINLIAKSVLKEGADVLTIGNTLLGMEIDNKNKKAKLYKKFGGYSGPAIKPIALRTVWQVYQKFKCPIIGCGGICDFDDAVDFIMVGASAVSIGSANYLDRKTAENIAQKFKNFDVERNKGII